MKAMTNKIPVFVTPLLLTMALSMLLTACMSNQSLSPRASSIYNTTGFGDSKQHASSHAIENAQRTCGNLPVTVVSDLMSERQYQDNQSTVYEVNVRYRCGV